MSDTNWAALAAAAAAGSAATLGVAALLRNSKHAGKALRSTTASGSLGSAVYESERAAAEYLLFHFGTPSEVMPYTFGPHSALDFAHRCAKVCNKLAPPAGASQAGPTRALDVGCAVGRSSFDMAGAFDEVVGVDFSQSFIDVANELKANGSRSYTAQVEGDIFKTLTARVDPAIPRGNVSFQQGDACALPESLGEFDVVLAANLLCRLPQPRAFLHRLKSLLKRGGHIVLVSPYSYLREYTPQELWLGGKEVDGKEVRAGDAVSEALRENGFELVEEDDMPFLIREHARKFQWGCSHLMVWRRV